MDWKRVAVLLALMTLVLAVVIYKNEVQMFFMRLFDSGWLAVGLWIYVTVGVFAKEIYTDNQDWSGFSKIAQPFFEISTYGIVGNSSLNLLHGIFLQSFFGTPFFTKLEGLDIGSIFLASFFLLIYCLVQVTNMYINVCTHASGYGLSPSE